MAGKKAIKKAQGVRVLILRTCDKDLKSYGSLASFEPDAVWIAAWIDPALAIDLDGKVKFPWADVVVAGTREEAIQFLRDNGCAGAIVGGTATAGYGGTATAGDRGTATAGDRGILNIRYYDGNRYRIATFYVGEDKIEPDTAYFIDNAGKPSVKARVADGR